MNIAESKQNPDADASGSTAPGAASHPGAKLREQREARNLSLETVARQLHLTVQAVRALEENDLDKLPPPVYVRGFLRSYARLVDMPEDEVVGALPVQPGAPKPSDLFIPAVAATPSRYWRWVPVVLALGAIGGLASLALPYIGRQVAEHRQSEPEIFPQAETVAAGAPALVPLPLAPAPEPASVAPSPIPVAASATPPQPSGEPSPLPPAAQAVEAPPPAAAEPPRPDVEQAPAPAPPPAAAPAEAPVPPPPNSLVLRFTGESWASVTDATGRRLLYEAGMPGAIKTVSGRLPLKVTLGRPANVSLEFNGQPFQHKYKDNGTPVRLRIGDAAAGLPPSR
jgi:cytoskeleton protein RodZ